MKLLAIGDVHIMEKNLMIANDMMDRIINVIKEQKPDVVVLLGDILDEHENVHIESLNTATELIGKILDCGVYLFVLIGNHDYINHMQFMTDKHPFKFLKRWPEHGKTFFIVDNVVVQTIKGYKLAFLPYVEPGRFREALETYSDEKNWWFQCDAIFGHQEIKGAKMGAAVSIIGDEWQSSWPLAIMGHIHDAQMPQKNVIYVGTPMQKNYGDSNDKAIGLFEFTGRIKRKDGSKFVKYDYQRIDLKLGKKSTVHIDADEFFERAKKVANKLGKKDRAKIRVDGTIEKFQRLMSDPDFIEFKKANKNIIIEHTVEKHRENDMLEEYKTINENKETGDDNDVYYDGVVYHKPTMTLKLDFKRVLFDLIQKLNDKTVEKAYQQIVKTLHSH